MLEVTRLSVRSYDLDRLDISWEIGPVAGSSDSGDEHAVFDYHFFVLRSQAALGPYDTISGPLRDQYRFRDVQVNLLHSWRQYHYKIKVVHVPTGEEREFGPSSNTGTPVDLHAAEIQRVQDIALREFMGRRCYLYPARTFGPRCSCYDVTLSRITRSGHKPCFGTGWLGGYMTPVEVWVQIDPVAKSPVIVAGLKESNVFRTTARMGAYPPVSPKDVLIENENKRWVVETVTASERLRSVVHQELVISEITRGDIEYDIPVRADVFQPAAAERNFTNPQNLESPSTSELAVIFGYPHGSQR